MADKPLLPPTFVEALKLGLNLREACDRADISHDLARQWVSKGRKAKTGPVRERYRLIVGAQIDFKVSLQAGLLRAVKSGDGKAVERLLSHFEDLAKPTETEDAEIIVTGSKVERLEALMRIANRCRIAAEKDSSHVAALGYLGKAAEYGPQLDAARKEEGGDKGMSDAEWQNLLDSQVPNMALCDLERFMAVYLDKMRISLDDFQTWVKSR